MAYIVIVEDERNIVTSLRMALEAEGHIVDTLDPLIALPKVICVPPDVLILNGRMPGMHGIQFFQLYREFSKSPVMFLSASADEIEVELARRGLPADAYMEKPFTQRAIVAMVKQLTRRQGSS